MSEMNFLRRIHFEGLLRLLADGVLINLAVLMSLAARLLYIVAYGNPDADINYQETLWEYLRAYGSSAWLLTLILLTIFTLGGFYTYGRFYRGRYKLIIVAQAVSVGYLIFGLLSYISQGILLRMLGLDFLRTGLNLPAGVLVLAWVLTMTLLVSARLWSILWKNVIRKENARPIRPEEREIHHVLVIGGAGYIGSALLPKLLDRGYRVRLLDLLLYGTDPIQPWLDHPRLEIMQADFRQIDKVVSALRDVDAVIHLGGLVGDPACALDEELTIDINLMATRMIAEVAKGSGVGHFIFASTCSVYGASIHKLDERSELNPVSLYARSKIASEKVLLKMADERFAPVMLRFGTIYGLSGRTRFDLVINLLTAKGLVDKEITIFGGDQWRPFVHVDDAALAILTTLEAPLNLVRNQVFNIGSNEQNYTITQVGQMIKAYLPDAMIVSRGEDADKRNYWVSFNKVRDTLGFRPRWTVEDGIQQVIDALRSGKVQDYRDSRYSNVKFLTEQGIYRLARNENTWAHQLMNETSPSPEALVEIT
jgi:nucleoside-diphosphate-sugar epimerase/sorbitol-specific phosphotransferase system component IIC